MLTHFEKSGRHEVFKKMITGSSSFPPLSLPSLPPFRPLALSFARLSRSLEQAKTSKNERIPKTNGRSMKYRNTGNEIIWTFVKLSFLSMSAMRQIWKARRQFIVMYDFRLA